MKFSILDFGFWIADRPTGAARSAVFNPKSKIQNPK
jgi:hypothetical protein